MSKVLNHIHLVRSLFPRAAWPPVLCHIFIGWCERWPEMGALSLSYQCSLWCHKGLVSTPYMIFTNKVESAKRKKKVTRKTCSQVMVGLEVQYKILQKGNFSSISDLWQNYSCSGKTIQEITERKRKTKPQATKSGWGRNWEGLPPSHGCCPGHKELSGITMTMQTQTPPVAVLLCGCAERDFPIPSRTKIHQPSRFQAFVMC